MTLNDTEYYQQCALAYMQQQHQMMNQYYQQQPNQPLYHQQPNQPNQYYQQQPNQPLYHQQPNQYIQQQPNQPLYHQQPNQYIQQPNQPLHHQQHQYSIQNQQPYQHITAPSHQYTCTPCTKNFTSQKSYNAHTESHTKCTQCSFTASKAIVWQHTLTHHPQKKLTQRLGEEEEIARYIANRKRKYPGRAVDDKVVVVGQESAMVESVSVVVEPVSNVVEPVSVDASDLDDDDQNIHHPSPMPKHQQKKQKQHIPTHSFTGKRQPLLKMLLKNQIEQETSFLIQCVERIVERQFYQEV